MNKEQEFLIKVINDYLNHKETLSADQMDWKLIYEYSKQQQLQGLVYYQCESIIDDVDIRKRLEEVYFSQAAYSIQRGELVNQLKSAFNNAQINFSLVKGALVMDLYENPELRTMGDTDVIIHKDDRDKVHEVMIHNGFSCEKDHGDEWYYYKHKMCVEIHDSMVHPHEGNQYLLDYFNNNLWKRGQYENYRLIPDWNFHFMYLVQHLSGHFMITGVGLRQFMDLVVVIQNVKLDWAYIEKELTQLNLWEFCKSCLSFCEKAFGLVNPVQCSPMDDDTYNMSLEKIFSDGVFGHENETNSQYRNAVEVKFYQKEEGNKLRTKTIFKTLFPSYEYMTGFDYCSFLINRKYLLPVAWIRRWIEKIIHRPDYNKLMNKVYVNWDDEGLRQRIDFISKWGL